MAFMLKDMVKKEWRLASGHRLCPGCPAPTLVKLALMATDYDVVVANATGCLEVSTTIYPYSAWKVPWIHNAFENAAATISGVEAAYKVLKRKGKIDRDIKFIAFGGDGGTYDIGIQALSGAIERGHDFLYILYDNEGYMNTGNQRSGATPTGANTTTAPIGKVSLGKLQVKKNITEIIAGHGKVYVAQASISHWQDFMNKVKRGIEYEGPAFINALSPCVRFWRVRTDQAMEVAKLGVETNYWPLYEVVDGVYKINYKPRKPKPLEEFLKIQGRFSHLFKREGGKALIEEFQNEVNRRWERLLKLEEATKQV